MDANLVMALNWTFIAEVAIGVAIGYLFAILVIVFVTKLSDSFY